MNEAQIEQRTPWGLVGFLLLLHILNQIDRQLVSAFAADIMRDLSLSRGQFGLIAGLAFSGVYAFAALMSGVLADRFGRVPVLATGVGIWSVFTALAGMAQGFWTMLGARPFVAAGEATLVPTATNVILARTPDRYKAAALGLFFAGIPLGIGGGFLIAGLLGPQIGWRGTFLVMGMLGLVALFAVTRLRDDRPVAYGNPTILGNLAELRAVFRTNPRVLYASLAMILVHCHVATNPFVQLWLVGEKGLEPAQAARIYGLMFVVVGLFGTFGSGLLVDLAKRRFGWDRAATILGMLVLLAPLLVLYRLAPPSSWLLLLGMGGSILFMTVIYGPLFAVIEEQLPVRLKATSTGFNILALNIFAVGGVAMAVGYSSEFLASIGVAQSWTWPLMGADALALLAIPLTWLAVRSQPKAHSGLPSLSR